MFLNTYEEYCSHYVTGAKKITLNSSYPKITKEPISLKLEKSYGNYSLYFNKNGQLVQSIHFEKSPPYFKIIYGYDKKGNLVSAMKLVIVKNELISISNFTYDNKGRVLTEKVHSPLGYKVNYEKFYIYSNKGKEVLITNDKGEPEGHTFLYTYDKNFRVIEVKGMLMDGEIFSWNKMKYDKTGNLIEEISLDENEVIHGTYSYFPNKNGLPMGYSFKSKDLNYQRTYSYKFNEKGHWIEKAMFNDEEPRYYYKRTLEYF